jgi:predicted porin
MKKQLVAVAVSAAFSVPALAQNITIYGVLDAGILNVSRVNAGAESTMLIGSGLHTTSRLGFRGSEDLGGGMSARFTLEGGLSHDSGMMGSGFVSSTSSSAPSDISSQKLFERQATVGIVSGAWSADFGRQNNLTAATAAIVDPQGFVFTGYGPNVALIGLGALPGSNNYGPASNQSCTAMTGTTALSTANCSNNFRTDNSIRANYSQAGWTFSGMAGLGEVAGNGNQGASQGFAINGKLGSVTLAGAYTKVESRLSGTINANALKTQILGASLPVGKMTVRASSGLVSADDRAVGNTTVNGLGIDIPIAAPTVLTLAYYDVSNDSTTANSAGGFKQTSGIVNYSLSKRTGLYAAGFLRSFNGDISYYRATGLKMSDTSLAAGIRHSF